jgi:hypothetical protein
MEELIELALFLSFHDHCTAAAAPRVRGSGAPYRSLGVARIELADE